MELIELHDRIKRRLKFDPRTQSFDEQTKRYVTSFKYKERQRIILLIRPQFLFTDFDSDATPGTSTVSQMRFKYKIRGESFTLNRNPYSPLDSFQVCFRKQDQYSHDDFWLHYVNPMLDEWKHTNVDYASVCDRDTYEPFVSQLPHMLACNEAGVGGAFQYSIENPIVDLVYLNFENRQKGEEYLRICEQFKSSLKLKGETITDDGDGFPDIKPVYHHWQCLNYIGISGQADFLAGYETAIISGHKMTTAAIYAHTIGEIERPDANLHLAYQSITGENTHWLDDPITEGDDYTVNENGCLISYKSRVPAFRNFDFAFQKLATQSIHAFSRRGILTDYNSIFMIEFANPFQIAQEVVQGTTTVKYVALRHFRLDTCLTDYSRVMYLAFLWLGSERIAEDQQFRQSVAEYFSLQRERDNQGLLMPPPPPRGPIPTVPGRSSQPTSTDTSVNTSTQFSQTQNRYQSDIVSELWEGESSHFEPNSDTTFEIELNEKPFKFINATLAQQYAISLRQYVVEDIQVGQNYNSQIFCIDAAFLNEILPNVFGPLKPTLILKIFDPSWVGDLVTLFQKYVDMAVRELQAYELLKDLNITPCLHLYGQLLDVSMNTGTYNPKSSGPFIAMEKLNMTTMQWNDVTRETLNRVVKPAYMKMHQAGVVHGDVDPSNWLFDENGQFKILDFANSRLSSSVAEHQYEIEQLYRSFGYKDPWMSG